MKLKFGDKIMVNGIKGICLDIDKINVTWIDSDNTIHLTYFANAKKGWPADADSRGFEAAIQDGIMCMARRPGAEICE